MPHSLPFKRIDEFILLSLIQESPHSLAISGYQKNLNRPVFLKLLKPAAQTEHKWIERFKREAQICAQLKNPHIVDIYTFGNFEGYFYIAMEYVQGISLKELLFNETILDVNTALYILSSLLEALGEVHSREIIHRDIKPGNILVDIRGDARLTDFGLAYLGEDLSVTQQDTILGTPAYMSPEQITGEPILPQSDYFSMGSTFYEMLTGRKAFSGENYSVCIQKILHDTPPAPTLIEPDLHPQIDCLVFWLLEKESSNRPASIDQITQKLNELPFKPDIPDIKKQLGLTVQKYYQHRKYFEKPSTSTVYSAEMTEDPYRQIFPSWLRYLLTFLIIVSVIVAVIWFSEKKRDHSASFPEVVLSNSGTQNTPDQSRVDSGVAGSDGAMIFQENAPVSQTEKSEKIRREIEPVYQAQESLAETIKATPITKNVLVEKSEESEISSSTTQSTLNLNIEPWGTLTLNGELVDSLAHHKSMTVEPGKYQLIISHPEFPPRILELQLLPGQTRSVTYSFLKYSGFLMIEVRPWADVYIDGKFIDSTPLSRPIILPEGAHVLELRHPSFQKIREEFSITPGDTLLIEKVL